jgi:hypothetical protein
MSPRIYFYTTVGGQLVTCFTAILTPPDIEEISMLNWNVKFKPVDLSLHIQKIMGGDYKRTKVRVPPNLLWFKEMPVDIGAVYLIREGLADSTGNQIFYLDYEAIVCGPNQLTRDWQL